MFQLVCIDILWVEKGKYAAKWLYQRWESTVCWLAWGILEESFSSIYDITLDQTLSKREYHNHRVENGCSRISSAVRNQIGNLFINDRTIHLRAATAQTTVRNVVQKELKTYPSEKQMSTALAKQHRTSRLNFAQNSLRKLLNDSGFLERIIFPDESKLSISRKTKKQNCRIWGTEHPNQVYETLHNSSMVIVWGYVKKCNNRPWLRWERKCHK